MILIENIDAWGFEHAIRGMRNPMNSWSKSDSEYNPANFCDSVFVIGENDLELMKKLYKAGTEHRKYLRQIFVSMDITAPLYWWKEFDTYKVGTVANSCSTMHKLHSKEIELSDFSFDSQFVSVFKPIVVSCESLRRKFVETGDKTYWRALIQLLPEGYNQRRTVTMNYENVVSIIKQREGHKLSEWNEFVSVMKTNLPYLSDIISND